jgi:hypothetical protein
MRAIHHWARENEEGGHRRDAEDAEKKRFKVSGIMRRNFLRGMGASLMLSLKEHGRGARATKSLCNIFLLSASSASLR